MGVPNVAEFEDDRIRILMDSGKILQLSSIQDWWSVTSQGKLMVCPNMVRARHPTYGTLASFGESFTGSTNSTLGAPAHVAVMHNMSVDQQSVLSRSQQHEHLNGRGIDVLERRRRR